MWVFMYFLSIQIIKGYWRNDYIRTRLKLRDFNYSNYKYRDQSETLVKLRGSIVKGWHGFRVTPVCYWASSIRIWAKPDHLGLLISCRPEKDRRRFRLFDLDHFTAEHKVSNIHSQTYSTQYTHNSVCIAAFRRLIFVVFSILLDLYWWWACFWDTHPQFLKKQFLALLGCVWIDEFEKNVLIWDRYLRIVSFNSRMNLIDWWVCNEFALYLFESPPYLILLVHD